MSPKRSRTAGTTPVKPLVRCPWSEGHPLLTSYHDEEWGVPVHDDRKWYEKIVLDGAQAGLSWLTILKKREAYRQALCEFDAARVARFGERDIARLMQNPGIVRNRLKCESAVKNARAFLEVQREHGSFDAYVWRSVGGATLHNRFRSHTEVPARTELSDALSKDLKKRGFTFVGSTIVYAFMQAAGLVNDHLVTCHRYEKLAGPRARERESTKSNAGDDAPEDAVAEHPQSARRPLPVAEVELQTVLQRDEAATTLLLNDHGLLVSVARSARCCDGGRAAMNHAR